MAIYASFKFNKFALYFSLIFIIIFAYFSGNQHVLWRVGHEPDSDDLGKGVLDVIKLLDNVRKTSK